MKQIKTDICVIGGGSGGLSVAAGAVQMGARVVLFEGSKMGGDCLNYGCVPSKALLAAGKAAYYGSGNSAMGVKSKGVDVNFRKVKAHVEDVIAGIAPHDSPERFRSLGCEVIEDYGKFVSPDVVEGGGYSVRAKYFVVATGSTAFVPPITGLDKVPYHTNETIFEDRVRPRHLVVVGGGPIGIEMSQAHRRLGCEVTVIEGAPSIMPRDNPELVSILRSCLEAEGIRIIEGSGVTSISGRAGAVKVEVANFGEIKGSHLLLAVGRRPNLDRLNLAAGGIEFTPRGIVTDTRLRSSNRRVFAIGDAAGRHQFTHIAGYHAGIVIRNMLFRLRARVDDRAVPWTTYTDPELAHVGLSEAEALERGIKYRKVEAALEDNDRARAERRVEGKVIALTDGRGRVIGASILAPGAGELIQPWILAISRGLKIGAMASYIAPYPTLGEASKRAAGSYFTPALFSERTRRIVRLLLKLPF